MTDDRLPDLTHVEFHNPHPSNPVGEEARESPGHERWLTIALTSLIVVGIICVFLLTRRMDRDRPPADAGFEEEQLYVSAATAKQLSVGFDGLLADWYWMRSLQYVGRKVLSLPPGVQLDNLSLAELKLLAPLLDASITLDPEFMEPYEYAAIVLTAIDPKEAIRITKKGIAANPSTWRLYQHLGYIYWQQHDFKAAGEAYALGAKIAGAPSWMEAMKARMASEGGSRATARDIYTRMYEQTDDTDLKEMARRRLMQLRFFDERDEVRRILSAYKSQVGHCPSSWREIEAVLRAMHFSLDSSRAPLDPAGTTYLLAKDGCDIELDPKSKVPRI